MADSAFTLSPGQWYALERYEPDARTLDPYVTPLRVDRVNQLHTGKGLLRLTIFKADYPEGVQQMEVTLRVICRTSGLLVAEQVDQSGRLYLVGHLSSSWLQRHYPNTAQVMQSHPDGIIGWLTGKYG